MAAWEYPRELPTDDVIPFFLQFARKLLSGPVSPREVLDEFVRFYRECRVIGAPIEDGYEADTFCIECGNYPRITAKQTGDFRGREDAEFEIAPDELQLSIQRIVHAVDALPADSEFDDDGFEMNITLYFGPTKDNASYFLEASTFEHLEAELQQMSKDPLILKLLSQSPIDTYAFVGDAG